MVTESGIAQRMLSKKLTCGKLYISHLLALDNSKRDLCLSVGQDLSVYEIRGSVCRVFFNATERRKGKKILKDGFGAVMRVVKLMLTMSASPIEALVQVAVAPISIQLPASTSGKG